MLTDTLAQHNGYITHELMQHMGRVVGLGVGVTHGCMLCTCPNTVAVCIGCMSLWPACSGMCLCL